MHDGPPPLLCPHNLALTTHPRPDEPATPYDEMDDHAKALLDEMLDRQAMINEARGAFG